MVSSVSKRNVTMYFLPFLFFFFCSKYREEGRVKSAHDFESAGRVPRPENFSARSNTEASFFLARRIIAKGRFVVREIKFTISRVISRVPRVSANVLEDFSAAKVENRRE